MPPPLAKKEVVGDASTRLGVDAALIQLRPPWSAEHSHNP